jgi:hypothetical protein
MIQLKPLISTEFTCPCGGKFNSSELLWQGLHVCEKGKCNSCGREILRSLPVNQSAIQPYIYFPGTGLITDIDGNKVSENWFSAKLRSIAFPVEEPVEMQVEIRGSYDKVIILNTLDYVYGHSLLFMMNLQRIISSAGELGVIVILQPMLRWLLPEKGVAEIWTVNLPFKKLNNYYSDLSTKINSQLIRFSEVYLSSGHVIPTNVNIEIEAFTGIRPYDFSLPPANPRITFVWREDPDRLWVRNIFLLKGFKKLGIKILLKPVQYIRVVSILRLLRKKLNGRFTFTVAGLGRFGKMPSFIDDNRIDRFSEESEKRLCQIYSESVIVIGVHGSSMILPSAHAGMVLSLMPSKRWGNFAEDILFNETDVRLASFQRRAVPLNLCIYDLRDILYDMIAGREYFISKFIHPDDL